MKRLGNFMHVQSGFSMTELMVVLVIIGVLTLLALPRLMPLVTRAKTTEAKLMLKQVYTLEKSFSAQATAVVDFNNNGTLNVWITDQTGAIGEKVPD